MSARCAVMAALIVLLIGMSAGRSWALETPNEEEWARIRAAGRVDEIQANMLRLNAESQGRQLSESEIVTAIGRDYGLPTSKSHAGAVAGSLRVNLDMNDVIDERDILPLGFYDPGRSVSTTVPWGGSGDDFQPNVLVLLVKFSDFDEPTDKKNDGNDNDVNHDTDWAEDRWFDLTTPADLEDTSVGYYYKRASYGKLELIGDVYNDTDFDSSICDDDGWLTSSYTREEIDGDGTGDTANWWDVIEDAVSQIDDYVDFSDYDANDDGYVDGLVTIYAGPDDYTSSMWHYRWYGYVNYTSDGVRVYSGIWSSEEAYRRTWCHEFGHELGLPDLYDVGGSSSGDDMPGTGYWGVMASWTASQGKIPPLPCGWARMHLRFAPVVDVLTTGSAQTLTINRATSSADTNTLFRVWRNGAVGKEFFLLEYRDTDDDSDNLDQNLPGGGGVLIWHVNEDRTTGNNHDNAFDPQRVWLECADVVGDPTDGDNPWRSGYNGADSYDYFDDSTTPNAKDYDANNTYVKIDPTNSPGGASMTVEVTNEASSGLPTLSWDSPASGATVSGDVTVDVTSNAASKVEYYVDGCLKHIETGPGPYSGFNWDTVTALDGEVTLRAIAHNSSGNDPVRVSERGVTVDNGAVSGQSPVWSDSFDSYSGDTDSDLLGLWNLHEDAMGLDIRIVSDPHKGSSGKAIAFAQSSFPDLPASQNTDDPNAGVYQGEDDEWLMTPRIGLYGYTDLELNYETCFRVSGWGEAILITQISDDDGVTWDELDHLTWYVQSSDDPHYSGWWRDDPETETNYWAAKSIVLDDYENSDVYIRFMFVGGRGYNVGMALDDFEITGTAKPLSLTSVSPERAEVSDSVTLNGNGFLASQGSGEVRFNDGSGGYVTASITSWTNVKIVCTVPSNAFSGDPDGVWVYQDFQESNKKAFTVVLPAPSIDDLEQL